MGTTIRDEDIRAYVESTTKASSSTGSALSSKRRRAAFIMHSRYDVYETTRAGKTAFDARWAKLADPDGKLREAERERKAESLKRAYFVELALKRHHGVAQTRTSKTVSELTNRERRRRGSEEQQAA